MHNFNNTTTYKLLYKYDNDDDDDDDNSDELIMMTLILIISIKKTQTFGSHKVSINVYSVHICNVYVLYVHM